MGKSDKYIMSKLSKAIGYKYIIAGVLFIVWISFFDENSISSHIEDTKRLKELVKQKEYYKERIKSDREKLRDLNSGMEELEKFAREQYYMSKPDEDVFVVEEKK